MQSAPRQLLSPRWTTALAAGGIVIAAVAAYWNSFSAPFVFDDPAAIVENKSIRHFSTALFPPLDAAGATGRPLVNLSLALNYALGGLDVRSYHIFNLAAHCLAALALFGLVRCTLARSSNFNVPVSPIGLAFSIALIWAVHPLLTESVVCVIQRNEVLVSLFYLLTLYCFARAVERPEAGCQKIGNPGLWLLASVLCCFLGALSKEVIASAPLMVLLYDRTFVAGSFRQAWRVRWRFYLALASTWLLLGWLTLSAGGNRSGAAGFGLGVSPWHYALTQCRAIALYLKLSFWPHPLVFDYGGGVVKNFSEIGPQAALLTALLVTTAWALARRPALGFCGAWFFAILAPSSSVIPLTTQTMAEHRMYLPLAAIVALAAAGLHACLGRRNLYATFSLAAGLGTLTAMRNEDYRSVLNIWSDAAAKWPANARAHGNVGTALLRMDRPAEAIPHYEKALALDPDNFALHESLGDALLRVGRPEDAVAQYQETLRLRPDYVAMRTKLAETLSRLGRTSEAIAQYREVARLDPANAAALHYNLGNALAGNGQLADAIAEYEAALRLAPDDPETHNNLGAALLRAGRLDEAIAHYQEVLRLQPDNATTHFNLAQALAKAGRTADAVSQLQEVLRLEPDNAMAREDLARLHQPGQ